MNNNNQINKLNNQFKVFNKIYDYKYYNNIFYILFLFKYFMDIDNFTFSLILILIIKSLVYFIFNKKIKL